MPTRAENSLRKLGRHFRSQWVKGSYCRSHTAPRQPRRRRPPCCGLSSWPTGADTRRGRAIGPCSSTSRTRAARSRSTFLSRRRRPRRAPAPRRSSSRRSTAPMRRRRPRRTSWASRGGRRVPPTCRSSIWPARRGRRRRPCLRADGRHHLRRRRSLESSRCCRRLRGRRRLRRLPGVRRLRRHHPPVLARRRLHRLRCSSWRRLLRRGWCRNARVAFEGSIDCK